MHVEWGCQGDSKEGDMGPRMRANKEASNWPNAEATMVPGKHPVAEKGTSSLLPSAAAAAAKSLQSCPTLCYPTDGSPPGSAIPGILQARTLEWAAISGRC